MLLQNNLSKKSAAAEADVFTTVSEITSRECSHFLGKDVDIVTPNGFEDSFVPPDDIFEEKNRLPGKNLKVLLKQFLVISFQKIVFLL